MELTAATKMIHELMDKHGMYTKGWTFDWDTAKVRFGQCTFWTRRIQMSKALTLANNETEVRDTILHEIAHALVGPGQGHGRLWKLQAHAIGARPEACYSSKNTKHADSPYTFECMDCHLIGPRFKRPSMSMLATGRHGKCKYRENKGKLIWKMRGQLMTRQIAETTTVLPLPMWQRQQDGPGYQELVAVCKTQAQAEVKSDLTQEEISTMWERLKKLEEKLS